VCRGDGGWLSFYLEQMHMNKNKKKIKKKIKKGLDFQHASAPLLAPHNVCQYYLTLRPIVTPIPFIFTVGLSVPNPILDWTSLQLLDSGPPGVPSPGPSSPHPPKGNHDLLVSLFHQAAANLGPPAHGFPPITPANISTLSIGQQMLLPMRCTSLNSSIHIASAHETLSSEVHDLSL